MRQKYLETERRGTVSLESTSYITTNGFPTTSKIDIGDSYRRLESPDHHRIPDKVVPQHEEPWVVQEEKKDATQRRRVEEEGVKEGEP